MSLLASFILGVCIGAALAIIAEPSGGWHDLRPKLGPPEWYDDGRGCDP